jgi:membrane protease YdiL (CAAX protease family)
MDDLLRSRGRLPVSAPSRDSLSPRRAAAFTREAAALLAVCALMLAGAFATSFVAAHAGLPVSSSLVFEGRFRAPSISTFPFADCAAMLLFMFAAPLLIERFRGTGLRAVGFRLTRTSGVLSAAAVALAFILWFSRRDSASLTGIGLDAGSPLLLALYFLIVALSEETAFRGILQRRLVPLTGPYLAIALASIAFLLWHGLPADTSQLAVRLLAGLLLGLSYHLSGSLLLPVSLHWAFNVAVSAG